MIQEIQKADHIITISKTTLTNLLEYNIVPPEKCSCIPLGVEPLMKKENIQSDVLKSLLHEDFILFVGCLEIRKNIQHVLEAAASFKDIHLVIAGSPGYGFEDIIKPLLGNFPQEKLHVFHQVERSDLAYLYESAFVTLIPSWEEGFGLPILEAMVHGCPIITSNRSANAEVGSTGAILVDPENANDSIRAIERLKDDAEFRNKKIQDGFQQAKKYSWSTYMEHLCQLYNSYI